MCCVTQLSFEAEFKDFVGKLQKLRSSVLDVHKSIEEGAVKSVFLLVLEVGNYINMGTNKGETRGIALQSLDVIRGTRTISGESSFLQAISELIDNQTTAIWDDFECLSGCADAADVDPEDLSMMIGVMEKKITKVEQEVGEYGQQHDEKFRNLFGSFCQGAKIKLEESRRRLEYVSDKLVLLLKLFAERGKTPKEGLDVLRKLHKFYLDMIAARNEMREKKKKKKKKKKYSALI
eukprot:Trichotokara_eunicae@DN275_c0_g1_i1.p1